MQKFETRDNSGALFINDKKAENHPDFKGKCRVNGVDMEVAVWKKTSAKGTEFMSLSFSEKWVNPNAEDKPQSEPQSKPQSDMPF